MIKNWGFFDANGNEITRGWQGYEYQARAFAQAEADKRGAPVEMSAEDTDEFDAIVEPQ